MVQELTPLQAYMVLNALPHIGPITLNRLLEVFERNPVAVLKASPARLSSVKGVGEKIVQTLGTWAEHFNLEKEEALLAKTGTAFVTWEDERYPPLLREIPDPPIGLYRKGDYTIRGPAIAIVGSRRTTLYGQSVARKLAMELARCGFCIVSGLARGIDTAAHEGALAVEGKTVAVLGCGMDIIYPPENLELYRRIAAEGAILTEFPFGRRADRQSFPMRNRVVAGISEAVIVVESDESGGSMITARFAGEQGRLVFAVPGRIDQASSRGCHQLLRDGAILCRGAEDVMEELNYLQGLRPVQTPGAPPALPDLAPGEAAVMAHFGNGETLSLDRLSERTGKKPHELAPLLMMLELKRVVVKKVDGTYEGTR
jgi:DNA processing protein